MWARGLPLECWIPSGVKFFCVIVLCPLESTTEPDTQGHISDKWRSNFFYIEKSYLRIVSVRIDISPVVLISIILVDRLVQILIDEMVLGRQLAHVPVALRHAYQVDLVEPCTFRADPRAPRPFLAVVEHFALQFLVRVVAVRLVCAVEPGLLQQDRLPVWLLVLHVFVFLFWLFWAWRTWLLLEEL